MKYFTGLVVVMVAVGVGNVYAEVAAPVAVVEATAEVEVAEPAAEIPEAVPAEDTRGMAVMTAGDVDAALLERVLPYAQQNLFMPVKLAGSIDLGEGGFDALANEASASRTHSQLFVIVLAQMAGNEHHGASYPDLDVAVVNVAAMTPEDGDAEKFGRRIEKQVMSSAGILLGLKVCPNPHCALCSYTTMERLDAKGRNFCPPCQPKAKKILEEKGALLETPPLMP